MKGYTLECCVDSVESALNGARGGASRLELCGNLIIGGTTPELALYHRIRRETGIRIHCLIRPRFGDFCYSPYELDIMKESIGMFREAGAQAVVVGALDADGNLNVDAMEKLIKEAGEMDVTLHRAFDLCRDPFRALDEAIGLGVRTILTSGQRQSCREGAELIRELINRAKGRIDIMAGGGVNARTISELYPVTGGTSYHMSGKTVVNSPMKFRKAGVSMGLPSFSEYEIWRTDEGKVRAAVETLEKL